MKILKAAQKSVDRQTLCFFMRQSESYWTSDFYCVTGTDRQAYKHKDIYFVELPHLKTGKMERLALAKTQVQSQSCGARCLNKSGLHTNVRLEIWIMMYSRIRITQSPQLEHL